MHHFDDEGDESRRRRGPRFGAGPYPGEAPFPSGRGHPHGGRPPWAGGGRARRGDIRLALLRALGDGPGHGYELIGRLEAGSGGAWRPSAGSVYPTLQLLQDEGLVTARDEDGRRVFELTDDGRRAAEAASARIGAGPFAGEWSPRHAELRQNMKTLISALRQLAAVGDDGQLDAASTVVREARQRLYGILAEGPTASPEEAPARDDL